MRFTVTKKLYAGFAVVLLLMAGLGVLTINKMNTMNEKATEIEAKWLPSVMNVSRINNLMDDMYISAIHHMDTTYDLIREDLESDQANIEKELEVLFSQYEKKIKTTEERKLFNQLRSQWNQYLEIHKKVIAASQQNNTVRARAYFKEADIYHTDMGKTMDKLVALSNAESSKASNEANLLLREGKNQTLMFIIAAIILGGVIGYATSRFISKPIKLISAAAQQIASGDLTCEVVKVKNKDEIGQLSKSFNQMVENLQEVVKKALQNSQQVALASEELTASSDQTSRATEHIVATIQQVADSSEEQVRSVEESTETMQVMAAEMEKIAQSAHEVSDASNQTSERAEEGNLAVQQAVRQMDSIHAAVNGLNGTVKGLGKLFDKIEKITSDITGIADQTNLIALNAAIEAARAGEHGRAFAVVADEIRKLAVGSAKSSQKIAEIVKVIQQETGRTFETMEKASNEVAAGMVVVHTAGESFQRIQSSVNEVTQQLKCVSTAIEQMSQGAEQVAHTMSLITDSAEENASGSQNVASAAEEQLASMEEITASASSLSKSAESLQGLISRFKV